MLWGKLLQLAILCQPTTAVNSSNIPSAIQRDFAAWDCTRNITSISPETKTDGASNTARVTQNFATSAATHSSAEVSFDIPSSMTSSAAAPSKTSTAAMVAAESPTFASPPMDAPSTPLARTIENRSGSARVPIPATNSQRVASAALSSSGRKAAALAALRKIHLLQTNSNMTRQSLSDWKKSLPALAALAKAAPGYRASQVPSSMPHIKFQGFDLPPTVGFKCLLCKRDLSFAPEGPISQPPIPPTVAALPCGHTFHDHCLQLITPEDQSKNPPCIPCAMGET
ncbi:uncharacterized protein LOC110692096 [Chenopodium quinoa]|uniref:uncharacterized protein LOC110692096 n=1 Tax=Chenopodium quinoa TaxID=63459 RepID=UPI000B77695A|nr:uncharacterized protein LOC110692096 [Chenopodium quinoa]